MTIFAVKKDDKLLIYTIAEWRRAAIVNYLIQEMGQKIFCTDTDESVERLWRGFANGATVVSVDVTEHDARFTLPADFEARTEDNWLRTIEGGKADEEQSESGL